MNALTNSMMYASTGTHPKNSIVTTVDVTDRTTATMGREYQCDPKRQELSPVLNHLLGDPHCHHIDLG